MSMRYLLVLLAGLAREAASKVPCTAALGLQPVYSAGGADGGHVREGDPITVKVFAVNDCVAPPGLETVAAKLDKEDRAEGVGKIGNICIKPVSMFNHNKQAYEPQPKFYDWKSVTACTFGKCTSDYEDDHWKFRKCMDDPHRCSWCAMCKDEPHGCFTMTLKQDLPLHNDRTSMYLFTIQFKMRDTISEAMAEHASHHEIVFQAQTPPAMLQITDKDTCLEENKGGGQGTVPYRFEQASSTSSTSTTVTSTTVTSTTVTSTTTRCEWPCCEELRTFMDNVEGFIQEKFHHSVRGRDCLDTCYAASADECPSSAVPGEPPFAGEAPRGPPTWEEAKVTRLEQEARVMQEKIAKLQQEGNEREQEAKVMREKIVKLEQKVMSETVVANTTTTTPRAPPPAPAPRQLPDIHPPLQLVAGAQDEAVPEPQGTNIALVVLVSVLCAVMVQVIVAALPLGRPASPSGREPLLLG